LGQEDAALQLAAATPDGGDRRGRDGRPGIRRAAGSISVFKLGESDDVALYDDVHVSETSLHYEPAGPPPLNWAGPAGAQSRELERSFAQINADKYVTIVRKTSLVMLFFWLTTTYSDYAQRTPKDVSMWDTTFRDLFILKLVGAPVIFYFVYFAHTRQYFEKSHRMFTISCLVAVALVMWLALNQTAELPTRCFMCVSFIIYVYTFTPIPAMRAILLNSTLAIAFVIAMVNSETTRDKAKNVQMMIEVALLLLSCLFFVGRMSWNAESLLRSNHLQEARRGAQQELLLHEEELSESLLRSMLPDTVLNELKHQRSNGGGEHPIADDFPDVTVLFCIIDGFSGISSTLTAEGVVLVLNLIYSKFDSLIEQHSVYKVETVGEVYVVVSGCPIQLRNHACLAAEMALDMIRVMPAIRLELQDALPGRSWADLSIKIGLNSGAIVAGVVGIKNPRYKLFGDVVNTASRMESTSTPNRVQCSESAYLRLCRSQNVAYSLEKRPAPIEVKGKGMMQTYFLNSKFVSGRRASKPELLKTNRTGQEEMLSGNNMNGLIGRIEEGGRGSMHRRGGAKKKDKGGASGGLGGDSGAGGFRGNAAASKKSIRRRGSRRMSALHFERHGAHDVDEVFGDQVRMPNASKVNNRVPSSSNWAARKLPAGGPEADSMVAESSLRSVKSIHEHHNVLEQTKVLFAERKLVALEQLEHSEEPNLSLAQELWLLLGYRWFKYNYGTEQDCHAEASFIAYYFTSWNVTLVYSLRAWLVVFALQLLADQLKWTDHGSEVNTKRLLLTLVCCFFVLIVWSVTRSYQLHHSFFLNSTRWTMLACTAIAAWSTIVSVLTATPSFAFSAVFIVWMYNLSILPLAFRVFMASVTTIAYAVALIFSNKFDHNDDGVFHTAFLFVLTVFASMPAYTQDSHMRVMHNTRLVIERQHKLLQQEQEHSAQLLNNLLPPAVVAQLKGGRDMVADSFQLVSVIFTDMKGFTAFSSKVTPVELVNFLNHMYSSFDRISDKHGVYKVEIIGDAYYAVTGCPQPASDHAARAVRASIDYQKEIPTLRNITKTQSLCIRIGVHSGPVVAGVVGMKDPRYHLFGDTVNFAEAMESNGVPDRVHMSERCYHCLDSEFLREVNVEPRIVDGVHGVRAADMLRLLPSATSASYALLLLLLPRPGPKLVELTPCLHVPFACTFLPFVTDRSKSRSVGGSRRTWSRRIKAKIPCPETCPPHFRRPSRRRERILSTCRCRYVMPLHLSVVAPTIPSSCSDLTHHPPPKHTHLLSHLSRAAPWVQVRATSVLA